MEPKFLQRLEQLFLPPFDQACFYLVDLANISPDEARDASQFLDIQALQKISRLHHLSDRQRATLTHAILRIQLGAYLHQDPTTLSILHEEKGKPYIENYPCHFNLAHTKQYAFIGIHPTSPLGVDIEMVKDIPNLDKVADSFMNPIEKEQFLSHPNKADYFYDIWCVKESYLKARGTGFLTNELPYVRLLSSPFSNTFQYACDHASIYIYNNRIKAHKLAVCIAGTNSNSLKMVLL